MSLEEFPSFMKGSFDWSRLGYSYFQPSPIDLLSHEAVVSKKPWISLAAIVEQAKNGNHTLINRLKQWFHVDSPFAINRISILVTGVAGTQYDLQLLTQLMKQGDDSVRTYACEAAALAGNIWLIPFMLEAWYSVTSLADHETIGFAISDLLEEMGGPIAGQVNIYPLVNRPFSSSVSPKMDAIIQRRSDSEILPPEFDTLVNAKLKELSAKFSNDPIAIWNGKLFSVKELAEKMLLLISNAEYGTPLHGLFIPLRHKFEASTGIDCSKFFKNGKFQPLSTARIVEEFLESGEAEKYEPGVRYFFGHRIPD